MTKNEAMKLAREALEWSWGGEPLGTKEVEAMSALRQALEQEPVREHDKVDLRCECCGYMTYHREHLGCIRAAAPKPEEQP